MAFYLEQSAQALTELRLGDAVAADVAARLAGEYVNAALGEIVVSSEAGRLVLDAGVFRSAVRPVLDAAGGVNGYVTDNPGIVGVPIGLLEENGAPRVVVGEDVAEYVFVPTFPNPPIL